MVSSRGCSTRLHQTALRGQRRRTLRLSWRRPASSSDASENPACRTSALQNDGLTLATAWREFTVSSTRGQSRAMSHLSDLFSPSSRGRGGGSSKQRGRERWRTSASRDQGLQRAVSCSTLGRARPWRASVRPLSSPPRAAWSRLGIAHRGDLPLVVRHGTGRPRRCYQSSTAACSGRRVCAAHRSRALPPTPPAKQ
jgi:hypothetical protein